MTEREDQGAKPAAMRADAKPVRLRLSRAWRVVADLAVHVWRFSTPVFVAGFGTTMCCFAIGEAHEGAARIGLWVGGAIVAWALSLAYEQGRANGVHAVGKLLAAMVTGERQVEITFTHEHRASPEALAIIRADAALARGRGGETGGDHG